MEPTTEPSGSEEPSVEPTTEPSGSEESSAESTTEPSADQTESPSAEPSVTPDGNDGVSGDQGSSGSTSWWAILVAILGVASIILGIVYAFRDQIRNAGFYLPF